MKELEKVKQISIASVLFILAVLIGVITYELPENTYAVNTKTTLEQLSSRDYIVSFDSINNPGFSLIDIRSPYEFGKGHLKNAINISTPEILNKENKEVFRKLQDENKTMVLYGKDPEEANIPFLLLYQLGYTNLKLLSVDNTYFQNQLVTRSVEVEKPIADVQDFIGESVKNVSKKVDIQEKAPVPKKIITVKKKKKKPVEGGC